MARIRAALIGAGFIAEVHARSIGLAGGELVGVAASTPDRSREAAAAFGAQRAFASAEEAVHAPDVDVVHICTPNRLHAPLAMEAFAAGKHVVCEKPLALDGTEAVAALTAARQSGRVAAVPFVYRYYPAVAEARERVRRAGAVHLLHGTYLQDWLLTADDDNWRTDVSVGGRSRAFADIGSHWCDLAEFITGDPIARVMAQAVTTVPRRRRGEGRHAFDRDGHDGELSDVKNEDAALVLFETVSGAAGSVVISQVAPGRKNRLWIELDGPVEALVFDQENPETLWCGRREEVTLLPRAPETMGAAARSLINLPGGHPQGYADCFAAFVADVYDSIGRGCLVERMPRFEDGLAAARLTDAVLASSESRQWTAVEGVEDMIPGVASRGGGFRAADDGSSPRPHTGRPAGELHA